MTNSVTAPKIAENNEQAEIATRQLVFEAAKSFSDVKNGKDATYVEALDEKGNVIGYVTSSSKGYGGEIRVMTGIGADGNVTGMEILAIEETAGLGMNAKKEDFRKQYVGNDGAFSVVKSDSG